MIQTLPETTDAAEAARTCYQMHRRMQIDHPVARQYLLADCKQKYARNEIGVESFDAMRALKQALDPHDIFNPGKKMSSA
jgi:D-lactate dehydrogenase (cytochrome)